MLSLAANTDLARIHTPRELQPSDPPSQLTSHHLLQHQREHRHLHLIDLPQDIRPHPVLHGQRGLGVKQLLCRQTSALVAMMIALDLLTTT